MQVLWAQRIICQTTVYIFRWKAKGVNLEKWYGGVVIQFQPVCQEAALKNVEDYIIKKETKLPKRASSTFSTTYRLESDVTPYLQPTDASYYMSLIGALNGMASLMYSQLALPWEGHLEQIFHIFGYLKSHHNSKMVFNHSELDID